MKVTSCYFLSMQQDRLVDENQMLWHIFEVFTNTCTSPWWTWWPRCSPATTWRPSVDFTMKLKVGQEVPTNHFQSSNLNPIIWESQNAYVLLPLLWSKIFLLVFFKKNFVKCPVFEIINVRFNLGPWMAKMSFYTKVWFFGPGGPGHVRPSDVLPPEEIV